MVFQIRVSNISLDWWCRQPVRSGRQQGSKTELDEDINLDIAQELKKKYVIVNFMRFLKSHLWLTSGVTTYYYQTSDSTS